MNAPSCYVRHRTVSADFCGYAESKVSTQQASGVVQNRIG